MIMHFGEFEVDEREKLQHPIATGVHVGRVGDSYEPCRSAWGIFLLRERLLEHIAS